MIDVVKKYISKENLINDNDTIIVGVSGGADSICLLCVLCGLRDENVYKNLDIAVVHINHGLRTTAMRDLEFTRQICMELNVPFYPVNVDVKTYVAEHHVSTEEAGRILRYQAFSDIAEKLGVSNYKIAVAHNMDDNAETMLFNMIRGTGLKGLTGIQSHRNNIIRPLLCVSRQDIEAYLEEKEMSYCTDETNLQDDYSRNKIRHYIKPVCEAINERYLDRFYELSSQINEAEDYLTIQTKECIDGIISYDEEGVIHLSKDKVMELHPYIRKRALLETVAIVAQVKKDIGAVHVNLLLDLFDLQVGKSVSLPYDVIAVREYDGIRLVKGKDIENVNEPVKDAKLEISGKTVFGSDYSFEARIYNLNTELPHIIPDSTFLKWFDYDKLLEAIHDNEIVIRSRKEGDTICINESGARKKIKSYFIDEKIPAENRSKIPLVTIGQDVVWIAGYRASSYYRATKDSKNVLEIKCTLRTIQGLE